MSCIDWIGLEDYKTYCLEFCAKVGVEPASIDEADWMRVSQCAADNLSIAWGGGSKPSPFKITAAFATALVECAPLPQTVPHDIVTENGLDSEIARYPKAFIAGIAFEMAREFLSGIKIGSSITLKPLPNAISISRHFYRDLIFTMAIGTTVNSLALILEACAYQANPDAQNGDRV